MSNTIFFFFFFNTEHVEEEKTNSHALHIKSVSYVIAVLHSRIKIYMCLRSRGMDTLLMYASPLT